MITSRRNPTRFHQGFTLVEAAIVLVIIGVGVTGLMQFIAAGSMANSNTTELTTAIELANNINEMMQGAPYSTLKSTYDDVTFDPPRDALGTVLNNFSGWTQSIDISYVDPSDLLSTVPESQVEATARVTVTIAHHGNVLHVGKWIVVRPS